LLTGVQLFPPLVDKNTPLNVPAKSLVPLEAKHNTVSFVKPVFTAFHCACKMFDMKRKVQRVRSFFIVK
jgi:hypothetical protein